MKTCVLVLSGLDPGGGAGLLADARAIGSAGAFACGVVTVLTVQSTNGLRRTVAVRPSLWTEQARVVLRDQRVGAIKVGALGNAANVRAAAALLASHRDIPSVVDPVFVPTRGSGRLLAEGAVAMLRRELLPRATLVTANAAEAAALTRTRVTNVAEARVAARAIVAMGAHAALVKGGHLTDSRATDVLATRGGLIELSSPRLRLRRKVHGAGCVLSSLIAGRMAVNGSAEGGTSRTPDVDGDLTSAVRWAKRRHHAALSRAVDVGGDLLVLNK